ESLDIRIKNRHRALGDAEATAILLSRIIERQGEPGEKWVKEELKRTAIPPQLPPDILETIPSGVTGVYKFMNSGGFVIYVGKAIDVRKRLIQHFAINGKESPKAIQMKA